MNKLLWGLIAGVLASCIMAALFVLTPGAPAQEFHEVASWFGLDSASSGQLTGFFLLLVIGALAGILSGLLQSRPLALGQALGAGLLVGFALWVVIRLVIGTLILRHSLSFGLFLSSFVYLLLTGMLSGIIAFYLLPGMTEEKMA